MWPPEVPGMNAWNPPPSHPAFLGALVPWWLTSCGDVGRGGSPPARCKRSAGGSVPDKCNHGQGCRWHAGARRRRPPGARTARRAIPACRAGGALAIPKRPRCRVGIGTVLRNGSQAHGSRANRATTATPRTTRAHRTSAANHGCLVACAHLITRASTPAISRFTNSSVKNHA